MLLSPQLSSFVSLGTMICDTLLLSETSIGPSFHARTFSIIAVLPLIIDMAVTLRCYHSAVPRVVVLGSRSLPPPLPRLSCRNRLRSQASVVFSQTARNQDARRTTPWTMMTTVIMVIVKASVFVAAVIGILGNVGMAVSSEGGESSQPLLGVFSGDCGWL
jgi:hypothetical protein